jgi:hypothetical protein
MLFSAVAFKLRQSVVEVRIHDPHLFRRPTPPILQGYRLGLIVFIHLD